MQISRLPGNVKKKIENFIECKDLIKELVHPVRDFIFEILDKSCKVLYFPIEDDIDGCHVLRYIHGRNATNFVYINTNKAIEKQVFTAAHELGHILDLNKYLIEECPSEYNLSMEEEAVNYFSACLLMPENLFNKKLIEFVNLLENKNDSDFNNMVRFLLSFMDYFFVPLKSVIMRLHETNHLSEKLAKKLLDNELLYNKINSYIQNFGFKRLGIKSQKKGFANLAELIDNVEKKESLSKNRISSLRTNFGFLSTDSTKKIPAITKSDLGCIHGESFT